MKQNVSLQKRLSWFLDCKGEVLGSWCGCYLVFGAVEEALTFCEAKCEVAEEAVLVLEAVWVLRWFLDCKGEV